MFSLKGIQTKRTVKKKYKLKSVGADNCVEYNSNDMIQNSKMKTGFLHLYVHCPILCWFYVFFSNYTMNT